MTKLWRTKLTSQLLQKKLNDKKRKVQVSLLSNLKSGKLGETKNYPVLSKTEEIR